MEAHDLSIIVVSWNVRDLLRACLKSVTKSLSSGRGQTLSCQVIVVDNDSNDGSVEMLKEAFPEIHVIANDRNLGFTKGNNQGLALSDARYVLLLNPDTEVVGDALGEMVAYMDDHPTAGALGPQLLYPDGQVQSSRRRFPDLRTAYVESTFLQSWFAQSGTLERYYVLDRSDDETQAVDWLVGACLLIRRETLEEVGSLDESYFMYSEELDWCYRAKKRGWEVVYLPTAQAIHHVGKSSEQVLPVQHIQFQRSKVLFFKKHHGRLKGEMLRFFLLASYLWQMIVEGLKWLVGHKRPLRRQRVAAYWQVLRSGLR
ncbi:MAG: glycosyltransferase [Anaerolineae bacterium]|nr:glycosyltransferase [Anaerolineae bacterium]NIN96562.1 glycosyltransferase [Anaerolineae bacterium]NIQ79591.1 glycosyltransferase [Anaerolineae bacterium]